ncbi:MAG: polysaccharide biosynthesis protein [Bacteroidales bacterium]|nr:polysaccharide biosynthesis protein [Bacteroidales bacterium]
MDTVISGMVSVLILLGSSFFTHIAILHTKVFSITWCVSSLAGSVLMFLALRTYAIIIRHTTFRDVVRFLLAVVGKSVLMGVSLLAFCNVNGFVPVILLADMLVTLLALLGVRLVMIWFYDFYKSRVRAYQTRTRVLVYGTSEKSESAILRFRNSSHYDIAGIISPVVALKGTKFADKHVYTFKTVEDIDRICLALSCSAIMFSSEADLRLEMSRLVGFCSGAGIKMLFLPDTGEVGGSLSGFVREVKIEDLLGRDEIQISMDELRTAYAGRTVMVTGAAGSIGSELSRLLATLGVGKLILFDNAETPMHNLRLEFDDNFPNLRFVPIIGDVRSKARLDFAFRTHRPSVVFHAAAYKHVPLMEENPCEAVLVNMIGSRNVADKCIEYGAERMVMISTDKAVNPTNIMGCSKRLAEIYVQSLGLAIERGEVEGVTHFVTTRFGNVLGSNGSVIPRFREQIAKGGPVTVTHPDITRFFMTIPEACRLVMQATVMDTANRICVFDMGEPVKIDMLARRMIQLSGLVVDRDIKIQYTGLRPGEKLYEEVLSDIENTEPTDHGRIRLARVRSYDYKDALAAAEKLEELSRNVEIPEMVKLMKQVVPEFISKNSRFSEYDRH